MPPEVMPPELFMASGLVILQSQATGVFSVGGTCGVYQSRQTMLTASHCVPDGCDVFVRLRSDSILRPALRIARNPTSDIAVLHLANVDDHWESPDRRYSGIFEGHIDGGDFVSFGYPVEGSETATPVARVFKGHIQRRFEYDPPGGGKPYYAAELSIPAPGGWSGGVTSYEVDPFAAVAIVTANVDSYATIDRLEEVERNGTIYREQISRVVSYGIAAMLSPHENWLAAEVARGAKP